MVKDVNIFKIIIFLLISFLLFVGIDKTLKRMSQDALSRGLRYSVSAGFSFVLETFLVFILALIGEYTFTAWVLLGFAIAVLIIAIQIIFFINYKKNAPTETKFFIQGNSDENKKTKPVGILLGVIIFAVIISATFFYMAFPTYYLRGGRDYGLYIVNAVHIAESGSIEYKDDALFSEMKGVYNNNLILYPGFYYDSDLSGDKKENSYNPQFLSFSSCAFALFYDVWGLEGLVRCNGIIAVLALIVSICYVIEIMDKKAGLIFSLFWLFCPAVIWNSRITESEIMAYLLLILSVVIFNNAIKLKNNVLLCLSVLFLSVGSLNRIDNYLFFMVLDAVLIAIISTGKEFKKSVIIAFAISVFGEILSLVYIILFHQGYFLDHIEKKVLLYLLIGMVFMNALTIFVIIFSKYIKGQSIIFIADRISGFSNLKWIVTIAFAVFLKYYYNVLASVEKTYTLATQSVKEFGYYISPFMYILFLIGVFILIDRLKLKDGFMRRNMLLIGFGISSLLLYTVNPSISSDHFWMSRRWMVMNYPFIMIMAACAASYLLSISFSNTRVKIAVNMLSIIITGIILVEMALKDSMIWNKSYLKEYSNQYIEIASNIPKESIVLTGYGDIASILRFVYNRNVVMVDWDTNMEELSTKASEYGKNVYYLGEEQISEIGENCWEKNRILQATFPEESISEYPQKEELLNTEFMLLKLTENGNIIRKY